MFTILPAPDHVGAYRLSQTLTSDDLDGIVADIEASSHDTRKSASSPTSPISPI